MSSELPPVPGRTSWRRGARVVLLEDVFVNWRVDPPNRDGHQHRLRRRPKQSEVLGRMVDVSESGTAIVAPVANDLTAGSEVRVKLGASFATLRLVRFVDLDEPGWRLYGAEIVRAQPGFREWIGRRLTTETTGPPDIWRRTPTDQAASPSAPGHRQEA